MRYLYRQNQNGSGIVEAFLIIVVIGILGFTGYFVWHSQQATQKTLSTINKSSSPVVAGKNSSSSSMGVQNQAQYLDIKEWGVKFTLPKDGTVVLYGEFQNNPDSLVFTTKTAAALGGYCTLDKDGLGVVTRSIEVNKAIASPPSPLNGGQPINGYYYYFSAPQGACATNNADLATNQVEAQKIKVVVTTLQKD